MNRHFFNTRTFALDGDLPYLTEPVLSGLLSGLGARVNPLDETTDILLSCKRADESALVATAQNSGVMVWDEYAFLAALMEHQTVDKHAQKRRGKQYEQQMEINLPSWCGHRAVVYDSLLANLGSAVVHEIDQGQLVRLTSMRGVDSIDALVLNMVTQDWPASLMAAATDLSALRSLAVTLPRGMQQTVPINTLLAEFPNIQHMWFGPPIEIIFDVLRHTALEQLHLPGSLHESILQCSLPNLRGLEVGHTASLEVLNECLATQQFPRLAHLALRGYTYFSDVIDTLKLSPSVDALSLLSGPSVSIGDSTISKLSELPNARTLRYLRLSLCNAKHDYFNGNHFPQLQHLQVDDARFFNLTNQAWSFTQPIHLSLGHVNANRDWFTAIQYLVNTACIGGLTLYSTRWSVDSDIRDALLELPIPVQFFE